ncbi:MAG: ATP-binding protein [Spirulinaceae cyanobacterium]
MNSPSHPNQFTNPFRPGAGHTPPYLAGRQAETEEFKRLLQQDIILENMILTGLRGVGKTVLSDALKPIAVSSGWRWVGTDLSESASVSENNIALRLITDLAVVTSAYKVSERTSQSIGFNPTEQRQSINLDYNILMHLYDSTPGLASDKLKYVLEFAWEIIKDTDKRGLIFAYDEAQNLSDHAEKEQYPTSLLLDVFQSIQKKNIPFMLVLVGLPTLFPRLVEARTFAERMFRVLFLDKLTDKDSRDAILKPIEATGCPIVMNDESVELIIKVSGGYPYFIQFLCREAYDSFLQGNQSVPVDEITRKLDNDFFSGRWARATDRQRELLTVIAKLDNSEREFTAREVSEKSNEVLEKPFSPSHVSQMLGTLTNAGLTYKNRYGKYSFAVPLLNRFILRQATRNL